MVCVKFHSAGGDANKVLTGIGAGNLIVNPTVHKFVPKFFQNYPLGLKSSKKGVLFWKSGKIGLAFFAGV